MYKRKQNSWHVFGKKKSNSRRYWKLQLITDSTPSGCVPVQVIESSQYLVIMEEDKAQEQMSNESSSTALTEYTNRVLGKVRENNQKVQQLQEVWTTTKCKIICAMDGGLKNKIGSSGYALYLPNDEEPFAYGYATEYQPSESASSTRQELLAQLAVEYWLADPQTNGVHQDAR